MAKGASIEHYSAAFERSVNQSASPWLRQRRTAALEAFAATGLPSRKNEEYRYLDLNAVARGGYVESVAAAVDPRVAAAGAGAAAAFDSATLVVFVDGRHAPALGRVAHGVHVHAWGNGNDDVAEQTFAAEPVPTDPMAALAQAFAGEGAIIEIPADTGAQTVHVLSIASGLGEAARIVAPRVDLRVGRFSRVTLVESFVGFEEAASLTLATTCVAVAPSANVEHIRVHDLPDAAIAFTFASTAIAADATYRARTFSFGGRLLRDTFAIAIEGRGAHADITALYHAKGTQVIDHHTSIDHRVPEATSHQLYRTLVDDEGHAVFNGKIFVRRDAQKTAAEQLNRNLLLSRDARVDTKPQLEIFADDVRCTHGATIGQLQRDELFYLESRGIPPLRGRGLLIRAFANEAFTQVSDAGIRAALQARLDARLPG
jgi:Fe-S cluster assembly protein SufD